MKITCKTVVTVRSHTQTFIEQAEGKFDAAMICLGVNDVTYDVNLRTWLKQQITFYDVLKNQFGVQKIYFSWYSQLNTFHHYLSHYVGF